MTDAEKEQFLKDRPIAERKWMAMYYMLIRGDLRAKRRNGKAYYEYKDKRGNWNEGSPETKFMPDTDFQDFQELQFRVIECNGNLENLDQELQKLLDQANIYSNSINKLEVKQQQLISEYLTHSNNKVETKAKEVANEILECTALIELLQSEVEINNSGIEAIGEPIENLQKQIKEMLTKAKDIQKDILSLSDYYTDAEIENMNMCLGHLRHPDIVETFAEIMAHDGPASRAKIAKKFTLTEKEARKLFRKYKDYFLSQRTRTKRS